MAKRHTAGRAAEALTLRLLDRLFPAPSWSAWKTALAAMLGLPLSGAQAALVRVHTGLSTLLLAAVIWVFIVGRRGGKTAFVAGVAVCLSCLKKYPARAGERLVGMLLAADRRQARILKEYISGLLHSVPELEALIVRETAEEIELSNGITIEVHTSSFRSVRGYSCIFVICDEIAFWPSDGAESDSEILNALRPTLATTGGPLILISTPHARTGALHDLHQRHFGREGDTRVWVAPSLVMNPTLDRRIVDKAYEADAEVAASEWGASFRSDLANLFDRPVLDACVMAGRRELAPEPGIAYHGFVDTASGSDESYSAAVAHKDEHGRVVLDALREWVSPFDPFEKTAECARVLTALRVLESCRGQI